MAEHEYNLIETAWLSGRLDYTGGELRSHFVREKTGIRGDGMIAFVGACDVAGSRLVDLEDREAGSFIKAKSMLHFICEHFQAPLREVNFRLRLFAAIVAAEINNLDPAAGVIRSGDDLFSGGKKLSVAIATVSPVSGLFHFGVNVDPEGAPVPAIGLSELGVDAAGLAAGVLDAYSLECSSVETALRKVRGVT